MEQSLLMAVSVVRHQPVAQAEQLPAGQPIQAVRMDKPQAQQQVTAAMERAAGVEVMHHQVTALAVAEQRPAAAALVADITAVEQVPAEEAAAGAEAIPLGLTVQERLPRTQP